jgi:DNA binding domain, excisionase family
MSPGQVAELLGVEVPTVLAWGRTGRLPEPLKLGAKTIRWRETDLKAWLKKEECPEA